MKQISILVLFVLMIKGIAFAQSPGINYQALILNSEEVQIPGSNISEGEVLLALEDVSFRFSILKEFFDPYYEEEQTTITDENGMVSLIVGQGAPLFSTFDLIQWNGTLKYLNVEIDIHSQNQGYVFLDIQKILYLPQTSIASTSNVVIDYSSLPMNNNYQGDLAWVQNMNDSGIPAMVIWNADTWELVNEDYDPTNEFSLISALDDSDRNMRFSTPVTGNQVWNESCDCIQVYNGFSWLDINSLDAIVATNGLNMNENAVLKLGGTLVEPTTINTDESNTISLTGLQDTMSTTNNDIMLVNTSSGVISRTAIGDIFQEEVTLTIAASNGQSQFATPLPIITPSKVNVYRNGVRIGFTVINTGILELEPEAVCYAGDEVRIVQFSN